MNNRQFFSCCRYSLYIMLLLLPTFGLFSAVISVTFRDFPIIKDSHKTQKIMIKMTQPGAHAKQVMKSYVRKTNLVSGIFGTYAGYLTVSDFFGNLIFPRLHHGSFVYLIVTTKMTPIMMIGNTIHHWELEEGTPVKMYKAELKKDDETKLLYWDMQEVPVPENKEIPSKQGIVILARPQDIYVPLGIMPTVDSPHLLLPDLYVKKSINKVSNALYMLNINFFFGTLHERAKANKQNLQLIVHP